MDQESGLARLEADLGFQRLNQLWAKTEIVLGLMAAGGGLMASQYLLSRPTSEVDSAKAAAAGLLFLLGAYLAMAGQRSHLYQSMNRLAAYVALRSDATGASSQGTGAGPQPG